MAAAEPGVPDTSYRLFVTDKKTGLSFLVDTGANISVIPRRTGQRSTPLQFKLYAANNTVINTYGEKTLELDLNLRRPYKWKFIVADVSKPIIGADFLKHHQLVVDLTNRRLVDGITNLHIQAPIRASSTPTIRSIDVQQSYHDILAEFPGTTRLTSMKINSRTPVEHYIETRGPPLFCRARPIPPHLYEQVRKEIENMMQQGICRPSKSPWSSPLHIVPKKNGDIRICGDYRRLNAITIPDRYPIPRVKDFTNQLSGMKIFSTIDLNRAYNQIPVREEDIEKTALICPLGLIEFNQMIPGLKNAGQTFQRYIHEVLRGLDFVFPFLDDLLIASPSETLHRDHLRQVLRRLEDNGITINPAKCNLGKTEVKFLGYIVSQHGIKPPEEKVKVITDYPRPKTIEELRRFLGMVNFYREHIPNAAVTQAPLNAFLHNTKKRDKTIITWNDEATQAFEACKASIKNAALLAHPSHDATLAIFTDASDVAAGAVLQQYVNNAWQPLGYFSKKFSDAQKKYSTYDRELLAIYMSMKHFRKIFEGRKLIIYTDHKPLTFAMSKLQSTNETPRRTRQLSFISEFTTDIRHINGEENSVADALSRIETITCPSTINFEELARAQDKDSTIQSLMQQPNLSIKKITFPGTNITMYCETSTPQIRPYVPAQYRRNVFDAIHNISHPGIRNTRKIISQKYFWPSMNTDIRLWAKTCIPCQKSKIHRHTSSELAEFPPTDRWEYLHCDVVGPLEPSAQGHRYLITMIDRTTSWMECVPTDTITAEKVAQVIYEHWIARFGCPLTITTDQGRQFESQLFNDLTRLLGIKKIHTTAFHAQANGKIEIFHKALKTSLRARLLNSDNDWVNELPTILLGLRTALKENGISPAQLTYGCNLRLPADFFSDSRPTPSTMDYNFVEKLRTIIDKNKPRNPKSHRNNKQIFVHQDLKTCSHVFIRTDTVRKPLQTPYEGPYKVLSRNAKVFIVQLHKKQSAISIDRLKPAYVLEDFRDVSLQDQDTTVPDSSSHIVITNQHCNPRNITAEPRTEIHLSPPTANARAPPPAPPVNIDRDSEPPRLSNAIATPAPPAPLLPSTRQTRSGRVVKPPVRFR